MTVPLDSETVQLSSFWSAVEVWYSMQFYYLKCKTVYISHSENAYSISFSHNTSDRKGESYTFSLFNVQILNAFPFYNF